ncbi:MAG: hypothetical protein M3198_12740, partial [Actinomycetota bacterium]|nr:hypothetical protein [Actinomycetota bacterium]
VQIDPETLRVRDRAKVGFSPTTLAVGEGSVWVVNFDKTITRVAAGDLGSSKTVTLQQQASAITVGDGFVWATLPEADAVVRIDPSSNEPVGAPLPVGDDPQGIAYGEGKLWVANQGDDTITEIDLHPDPTGG